MHWPFAILTKVQWRWQWPEAILPLHFKVWCSADDDFFSTLDHPHIINEK